MVVGPNTTAVRTDETPPDLARNAAREEWSRHPDHDRVIAYLRSVMRQPGESGGTTASTGSPPVE